MSLIRKHVAVLQAWACLDLVTFASVVFHQSNQSISHIHRTHAKQYEHSKNMLLLKETSKNINTLTM